MLTTHVPLFAAARGAVGRRGAPQGGGRAHGTGYVPEAIPRQLRAGRPEAGLYRAQFLKERREERQAERVVDRPAAAVPGAEGWASIVYHTKAVPGDSQEG